MSFFTYEYSIEIYFRDKHRIINFFLKYNFFFLRKDYIFSSSGAIALLTGLQGHLIKLATEAITKSLIAGQQGWSLALTNKQIKSQFMGINFWTAFSNKYLYAFLHCIFFACDWLITKPLFRLRRLLGERYFRKKKKRFDRRLGVKLKKKRLLLNSGKLSITFTKRNMFLNLSTCNNKSLLVTTLRRLGFLGRRRREYLSVYNAVRLVKQNLRRYKIKRLSLRYSGWNRFRVAVKNALKCRDKFRVPILYVKFVVKIPHNGCRLNKKKKKKRKKKVWLKKKKPYTDKRYKNLNV